MQASFDAAFDAYVTAIVIDAEGFAAFALGDGSVRIRLGDAYATVAAHDGAVLCAAPHPSGAGLVTGGDDGAVVWSRVEAGELVATRLAQIKGRWIDAVAANRASGLIAYAAGREVHVRDIADQAFSRVFSHEKSVAGLAFEPKGRRLAAATYGGVALWYARIADQKPMMLKWAGSHIAAAFSPDGKFLISSMQENQLHGWRLADAKDMRMGGYPAKVRSMAFFERGLMLATSGANGAVIWPFAGASGPMGKSAQEIGHEGEALVTAVAAAPALSKLAAGLDDGRVWIADLASGRRDVVRAQKGAPISALALSTDGALLAWGDEDGGAGLMTLA